MIATRVVAYALLIWLVGQLANAGNIGLVALLFSVSLLAWLVA